MPLEYCVTLEKQWGGGGGGEAEKASWLCKSDGLGLDSEAFCIAACSFLALGSGVLREVKRKHAALRR